MPAKQKDFRWIICGGVLALLLAAPLHGADRASAGKAAASVGIATSKRVDELGESIRRVALARQLIADGVQQKDALSLIVAMRIIQEVRLPANARIAGADRGPGAGAPGHLSELQGSKVVGHTIEVLAKKARQFAGGRQDLLALVDDAASAKRRGAGGLVYAAEVQPGQGVKYAIRYEGGKPAVVYVDGDGSGDIDLYVYDPKGRPVCADTRALDIGLCEWVAPATARYTVEVVNRSGRPNAFALLTN